ncbi:COX15/CtaA family protein [Micropruina sp.]|uniref:COX15/CtaA family protein n=1 Tax=Micropruina sp. TaxID=2737536 RepID=UPI00262B525D|nr:COX15/CtaA family protein [Micropruina sp.]
MDLLTGRRSLRRWAVANLIANMVIVWTGALVRLTKSGLGCSTWPECDAGSYVPQPEAEWHAFIEFGNRTLTFVLIIIALGTAITAFRTVRERRIRVLTIVIGLGIGFQGVIGGITVLTELNPWVVGLHMVLSVGLIVACVTVVHDAFELRPVGVPRRLRLATQAVFWLSLAMMYLGTVVTGAGPHSGDGAAQRNGFDLSEVARLHSVTMWITLAITLWLAYAARGVRRLQRAALGVIGTAVLQAIIGYTQYFNHLPMGVVFAHMIGTTLYTVAISHLWLSATSEPELR